MDAVDRPSSVNATMPSTIHDAPMKIATIRASTVVAPLRLAKAMMPAAMKTRPRTTCPIRANTPSFFEKMPMPP